MFQQLTGSQLSAVLISMSDVVLGDDRVVEVEIFSVALLGKYVISVQLQRELLKS